MEPNYTILAVVALVLFAIILFFLSKNRRDRKKLEEKLNRPDVPPHRHEEDDLN